MNATASQKSSVYSGVRSSFCFIMSHSCREKKKKKFRKRFWRQSDVKIKTNTSAGAAKRSAGFGGQSRVGAYLGKQGCVGGVVLE